MNASVLHNRAWCDGNWASALIWGRNKTKGSGISSSYLAESTVNFKERNYAFTRAELVDKSLLFLPNVFGRPGQLPALRAPLTIGNRVTQPRFHFLPAFGAGRVGAYTFGYVRDIVANSSLRVGIGGDVTVYGVPRVAQPGYGSSPVSYHFFIRIRPGKAG